MANVIKLKQGSGSNPQASDLVLGELAIRTDGTPKLFALNDAGNVVGLGGAPDDGSITSAKIADGAIVNADINASAAIDGTKISPDFGSQNIQTTGSLTGNGLFINSTFPRIQLNDTNNNSDFSIYNGNGFFRIFDDTNGLSRFHIASDGTATFSKNLDCLEGIDVTGNLAVDTDTLFVNSTNDRVGINQASPSYQLDLVGTQRNTVSAADTEILILNANMGTNNNRAFLLKAPETDSGSQPFRIQTGNALEVQIDGNKTLNIDSSGQINLHHAGSGVAKLFTDSAGIGVNGNITVTGTVDGRDVATDGTKLDGIESGATADQSASEIVALIADQTIAPSTIDMEDNEIIKIGNSDDLQLSHNGNNSVIADVGNGNLSLQTNGQEINLWNSDGGEYIARFLRNGSCELFEDGTKRFETTASGANINGSLSLSGTVDGVDIAARDTLFGGLTSSSGVLSNGVTATTQSAGDNSTKVATTAYTDTAIANLADSAPSTLNTLNELAAALGDDANFSTTVTNSIATKLALAGGTLTGGLIGTTAVFSSTSSAPALEAKGDGSSQDGYIQLNCSQNSHGIKLASPAHSAGASYTFTFPSSIVNNGVLKTDGSANTSFSLIATANVADNAITLAKMQNVITDTILGRTTNGTGDIEVLSAASVRGIINVEDGATADQSASEILTLIKTVDGAGSGLDADTLDGISSASFLRSDAADSMTGQLTMLASQDRQIQLNRNIATPANYYAGLQLEIVASTGTAGLSLHRAGNSHVGIYIDTINRLEFDFNSGDVVLNHDTGTIWGSGNDGSGSGLDSDLLDGQHGSYYLDYNNFTSTPTIPTNNNQLTNGAGYITSAALAGASDGGNAALLDGIDSTQFVRADADDTLSGIYTLSSTSRDCLNFSGNATSDNRGIAFNGRIAISADYNDGYLRLNNASEFSNGIYTPGVIRADGGFQVDGNEVISGSGTIAYSKLTGTPTIPTNNNQLTNGAGYITSASFSDVAGGGTFSGDVTFNGGAAAVNIASASDIRFNSGSWTGNSGSVMKIQGHDNALYIVGGTNGIRFREDGTDRWFIDGGGHLIPASGNTYNIGSTSNRVNELFVNDMHFSNKGSENSVDGSWGDWTLQEGEEDIFMINNRSGKKFKIAMIPV